jgi:hypothetical protein
MQSFLRGRDEIEVAGELSVEAHEQNKRWEQAQSKEHQPGSSAVFIPNQIDEWGQGGGCQATDPKEMTTREMIVFERVHPKQAPQHEDADQDIFPD